MVFLRDLRLPPVRASVARWVPLSACLLWAVPGVLLVPRAHAQDLEAQNAPASPAVSLAVSPARATVSQVEGDVVTLGIGSDDGVQVGAIYELALGEVRARLRVTEVEPTQSRAVLQNSSAREALRVGETAVLVSQTANPTETGLPVSTLPATALLTSLRGDEATLAVGRADGVVVGAIYALPQTGTPQAFLQITRVGETESTARFSRVNPDFTPTVGDSARFERIQVAEPPVIVTPPVTLEATPEVAGDSATVVTPPRSVEVVEQSSTPVQFVGAPSSATITALDGDQATLSAGASGGASVGRTVPVVRDGSVIALLRITEVGPTSSRAVVVFRDEAVSLAVGDPVGLVAASQAVVDDKVVTASVVPYESGASNVSVPKADRSYELLASLASSGLIKSQPPRVFRDDGARRHRVAEDIVFSRAQIAGFVREALSNYDGESARPAAALSILVADYRRDLRELGVPDETISQVVGALGQNNLRFGVSSFTRARLVVGDTDEDAIAPFGERFGAARLQTGLDSRINVFGSYGSRVKFFGQLDTGSDIRDGDVVGDADGSVVRNAYVSYDAGALVRGLTINVGRKEYWWGPGRFGTTTLGDAAGGLDSLNLIYQRGNLRYEGLYARLGEGPAGGDRSLYGQNLSYRFGQSGKLGLTTTILAPKDSFKPTLLVGSVLPVPLYALDRLNQEGEDTNAVVGGYAELGIARGLRVHGEIVLDDFSLNQRNRIENRNGGLVGFQYFNPNDPAKAGLTVEYARLNATTYVTRGGGRDADYDYYYRGAPLGYHIAPIAPTNFGGADSLRFEGYFRPQRRLTLWGGLEYSDLNAEDQNFAVTGPISERGFSRQRIYRFAAAYDFSQRFTLTARAMQVKTDQPDFVVGGSSAETTQLSLEIGRSF